MNASAQSPKRRSARPPWLADGLVMAAVALLFRLAAVAWAWGRFPPAADGEYYHRLALRLADGQGYTWLWPDGAVTAAAHYPVGYPAALALLYRWGAPWPELGMVLNAVVGALGVVAVHRLLVPFRRRRIALLGAGLAAVHPALVAYTPAIMTEGVTASLVAVACWIAHAARSSRLGRDRWLWTVLTGLVLGMATLVRPQCILLAPLLGLWLGWPARLRSVTTAAAVTAVALAVCAPWTARNCDKMGRCALVSVNGGWNLLIGTDPAGRGAWAPLRVPPRCREVFDEADKDRCFEQAAWERIAAHPGSWLALAPHKLSATFDYCGAPGWYLHESNSNAFDAAAKVTLGTVETLFERLLLLLALVAARPRSSPLRWLRGGRRPSRTPPARLLLRWLALAVGLVFALLQPGWVAFVALVVSLALRRPGPLRSAAVYAGSFMALLTVMVTHVLFFGAGRYALVLFPLLCALAALGAARLPRRRRRSA